MGWQQMEKPVFQPGSEPDSLPTAVSRPGEGWRCRKLSRPAEVVPVLESVVADLEATGYSHKETFAVRLALEEALVNAIKHGHKGDPGKEVCLSYRLTPCCFLAEVQDQGPGFRPEDVPDPLDPANWERSSGRGLLLMHSYMTWVRYNDTGTCVTMCKERTTPAH
jgi:serine/threonine-protein kinase RsbW